MPSWRPDIHGAADLVEEVVRIAGLDKVPSAPMPRLSGVARPVLTAAAEARAARTPRAGRPRPGGGHHLVVHHARDGAALRRRPASAGARQPHLERDDVDAAEPAAGPAGGRRSATATAASPTWRCSRWARPIAATSPRISSSPPPACAPAPRRLRAPAAIGRATPRRPTCSTPRPTSFALLAALGFDAAKAQVTREAPAWFHPGRSATLRLGPKVALAHFGEMHPRDARRRWTSPGRWPPSRCSSMPFRPSARRGWRGRRSRRPTCCPCGATSPSCSIADVPAGDVIKAAVGADKELIADVGVFDVFEGEGARRGQEVARPRGHAAADGKTLTDEEIEAVAAKVVAEVSKATGGEIRS